DRRQALRDRRSPRVAGHQEPERAQVLERRQLRVRGYGQHGEGASDHWRGRRSRELERNRRRELREVMLSQDVARAEAMLTEIHAEMRGVTRIYPAADGKSGLHALGPVDLALRRGEFYSVIGPSGCGKSTLLDVLAGL